jgi:hypothetical protein
LPAPINAEGPATQCGERNARFGRSSFLELG